MRKQNDGFTLIELLIVIVVGTLVTAAASTLLLLGFRINAKSNQMATQQNEVRIMLEVIGTVVSEEAVKVESNCVYYYDGTSNQTLLHHSEEGQAIVLRGDIHILEDVVGFTAEPDGQLVTFSITMTDGQMYTTSIYCRLLESTEQPTAEGDSPILTAYSERNYQEVLSFAVENAENPQSVTEFLTVLASQYGSRGQILGEAGEGTGEYFSQWYIGGYEDNPGWNADTPWCGCYLSWALAQCQGVENAPRFANVDTFWVDTVTDRSWSASNPEPGDIVFFDWIPDETYDPQHVGAVIAVTGGWVYTIEGNSGGRVTVCRYEAEDSCILGYAKLQWK